MKRYVLYGHYLGVRVIALLIALACTISSAKAQLIVDNSAPYDDPTYLVQNIMFKTGLIVTNVSFNGSLLPPTGANADMIGYFNGAGSNLNIAEGVLINTGTIYDAPGPNDSGSDGIDNGTPGDPDLDQLAGFPTFNAAILEFDFETVTDGISFRYVFASEEYNEFVCSGYNDVFGFFVSGPGVSGPFLGGAKNIALIPSTSDYVGINSVNNGTIGSAGFPGGCGGPGDPGLNQTAYYVDNEALGGQSVQYDGFTTVLTAQTTLIPCTVYHMKIAVADAGDGIYDSGVFLEAANIIVAVDTTITICLGDSVVLSIDTSNYLGAQWNTGDTTASITVSPTVSTTYTVVVTDVNTNNTDTLIYIVVVSDPTVTATSTDVSCNGLTDGTAAAIVTNGVGPYSYSWSTSATTSSISGLAEGTYSVTVTDSIGCTKTDSTSISTTGPQTSSIIGWTQVSPLSQVQYEVSQTLGSTYNWIITGGSIITGQGSYVIEVQWSNAGMGQVAVVETDTAGCVGDTVTLAVQIGTNSVIAAYAASAELLIHPNPTTGTLTVEGVEGTVMVYDIYGRLVLTTNTNTLDISQSATGIYFVRVVDQQGRVYSQKVIKQ